MLPNWREPETSIIHLADGTTERANVNGISLEDGSGWVMIHGREIRVIPCNDSTWHEAKGESNAADKL